MQAVQKQKRPPNRLLKRQRELRGWSRGQMVLELQTRFPGVAVTTDDIARWEYGKRRPSPYYREKLCILFETTADKLGLIPQEVSCDQHVEEGETDEQAERQNTSPEDSTDEDVVSSLKELLHQQQAMTRQALCWYEQICQLLERSLFFSRSSVTPGTGDGTIHSLSLIKTLEYMSTDAKPVKVINAYSPSGKLSSGHNTLEAGIALLKEYHHRLLLPMLSIKDGVFAPLHTFLDSASQDRLAEVFTNPFQIDDTMLIHLEAITRGHWHLFLHVPSKIDLLSSFWGHWQTLLQFLKYPLSGAMCNRLYSTAGESAQMIGDILFDIQDYQHAQNYYDFSIYAAKEAGNNVLRAVGLGRLSFLPIYREEPQQAYPLLQEAKQLLISVSRPTIYAWLSLIEAEVVAHLRDETACERALKEAVANYHQGIGEEDRLWTRFNDATISGYKGACYLELQKPQKALAALRETLNAIPEYSPRHRSLILADMAAARLQMKEIKEACILLRQALEITTQTKSLLVLMRIERVRKGLEPWKETTYVQKLDVSITEFLPSIIT